MRIMRVYSTHIHIHIHTDIDTHILHAYTCIYETYEQREASRREGVDLEKEEKGDRRENS